MTRAGRSVTLWAREIDCVNAINTHHENKIFLPGITLSPAIIATSDMAIMAHCDAILSVTPAQHTRTALKALAPHIQPGLPVILCSKGIEISSLSFMTDVLADVLPEAMPAVLAGPSFAIDVAKGLPAAVSLAVENEIRGMEILSAISSTTFRPYLSDDLLGAEIGGAVKNVLAIACGIVLGKGLGRSAHAALIARGFSEMTRLGMALGCKAETLTHLSGLGDLVLTCSSETSRNMSCGMALGKGESLSSIMSGRMAVTEGVATAPALKSLSQRHGVDMPICSAVCDILDGKQSVDSAIIALLSRVQKKEN